MSGARQARKLADPVAMEVFSNRLLAIAEDMGSILIRSSFSSNIKERKDASTAVFDARGRLVAQADHIPIHLGAMIGAVETILTRYRLEDMAPGDAFICNDPYLAGGSHLPDVSIITLSSQRPAPLAACPPTSRACCAIPARRSRNCCIPRHPGLFCVQARPSASRRWAAAASARPPSARSQHSPAICARAR